MKNIGDEILQLIPKTQDYLEYMIAVIIKIPRTEKFSIGNEYKNSMYKMLSEVMYVNKSNNKMEKLKIIDTELNIQRILLRIMVKFKWIDIKKFNVSIEKINEIGKILGGLIKYYAKNNTKPV